MTCPTKTLITAFSSGLTLGALLLYAGLADNGSEQASLYQREAPARVYGPTGALVFTGEISSEAGDYVTVCKHHYMPTYNLGCMTLKVGGQFVVVAAQIGRDGKLK